MTVAVTSRSTTDFKLDKLRFWLGLVCAAAVHTALIVGAGRSSAPRYLGEPDGRPDAITVDLIDASELKTGSTGEDIPAAPIPQQAPRVPQQPPRAVQEQQGTERAPDADAQGIFALPGPPGQHGATGAKKNSRPAQNSELSLRLDLPEGLVASAARGASATRPADITRSGENDEFGRRVIRALRQTMPSLSGTLGRATIRFLLSERGNIAELQLVRSSGNAELDRSVVFASKQSSFPIPPTGSTVSDRTFLVTYIYN